MTISKLIIKNYRSIESCELELSSLNALVGENNAGKTNILRALKTVLGGGYVNEYSFDVNDYFNHDLSRDIEISLLFDNPLIFSRYGSDCEIPHIQFLLTSYKRNTKNAKKGDPRFVQQCLDKNGELITVLKEVPRSGQPHKYEKLTGIPKEIREQLPVIYIGTDRSLEEQQPSSSRSLLRRLFYDVDEEIRTSEFADDTESPKRTHHEIFKERLALALESLQVESFTSLEQELREKSLENLGLSVDDDSNDLKFEFSLFDSIDFLKTIELSFRENERLIPAEAMGDGTKNALILSIFQVYEQRKKKGAIFLIEEPEIYLHPHRRRYFYRTLKNISHNNQILYTTHSPEFVDVADYQNIHLVYKTVATGTKTRASNSHRTSEQVEKLRREIDSKRSEIFFSKHVILIEGETEELALPEYAKRLNVDLDLLGCSIVNVRGKTNLLPFAEILYSFSIPFSLVYDVDDQTDPAVQDLNCKLQDLSSSGIHVLPLTPDFEGAVRAKNGDSQYETLTQRYPSTRKPTKQRLIASDSDTLIADEFVALFSNVS